MKKKLRRFSFISTLVLIIAILYISLFSYIYIINIQNGVEQDILSIVKEAEEQRINFLIEQINKDVSILSVFSSFIAQTDSITSSYTLSLIENKNNSTEFNTLNVIDMNGNIYDYTGLTSKNVKDKDYFIRALNGDCVVIDDEDDDSQKVIMATPIKKYGKVIGVLLASKKFNQIKTMLDFEIMGGKGHCYISKGTDEIYSYNSDNNNGKEIKKISENIGQTVYSCGNDLIISDKVLPQNVDDGTYSRVEFIPINIDDWCVITILPRRILTSKVVIQCEKGIVFFAIMLTALIIIIAVISKQRAKSKEALQNVTENIAKFYNDVPCGILQCYYNDTLQIITANNGFYNFMGYKNDEFESFYNNNLIDTVYDEDKEAFYDNIRTQLKNSKRFSCELRVVDKENKIKWVWIVGKLNSSINGNEILNCSFVDITSLKKTQNSKIKLIEEEAKLDSLTHLYNKQAVEEKINRSLDKNIPSCLMAIDIDNFKGINDTLGHIYGDVAICEIAKSLKSLISNNDILGRIGGDEFVIFFENKHSKVLVNKEAEKVVSSLSRGFSQNGISYDISGSVGIALYPDNGKNYNELFNNADKALYWVKNNNKNKYLLFDEDLCGESLKQNGTVLINSVNSLSKNDRISSNCLIEYILNIFNRYEDFKDSMSIIFKKIIELYGCDRIFLDEFDVANDRFVTKYEQCLNQDSKSENIVGSVINERYIDSMHDFPDNCNIYYCDNINNCKIRTINTDIMKKRGVKSFILCFIIENGIINGVLGIEYNNANRIVTSGIRNVICVLSKTITPFILRENKNTEISIDIQKQKSKN